MPYSAIAWHSAANTFQFSARDAAADGEDGRSCVGAAFVEIGAEPHFAFRIIGPAPSCGLQDFMIVNFLVADTLPPSARGMSRPLLKFGGGSVEILRDVLH